MKAILLQVGFDSENGGYSAPLFKDGSFVYLPIPERRSIQGEFTYADYERLIGKGIIDFLPTDMISVGPEKMVGRMTTEIIPVGEVVPHADPDFKTFTYGDQTNILRGRKMLQLQPGDYIFFFQSFVMTEPSDLSHRRLREIRAFQSGRDKVYGIIGYFELERLFCYHDIQQDGSVRDRLQLNAHMKRSPLEQTVVIATGTRNSRMLGMTKSISEIGRKINGAKNYVFSQEFSKVSGLDGQVYRAVKTIEGAQGIHRVIEWLDNPIS